jgi:hypothetical protein
MSLTSIRLRKLWVADLAEGNPRTLSREYHRAGEGTRFQRQRSIFSASEFPSAPLIALHDILSDLVHTFPRIIAAHPDKR